MMGKYSNTFYPNININTGNQSKIFINFTLYTIKYHNKNDCLKNGRVDIVTKQE